MKLRQYDIFGDYTDELVASTGDDYADFTAKFEPKKTTDDCYTPAPVYDAVLGFCRSQGWVSEGTQVVRPFWPGADYTKLEYPDGCVVVDNPPFSIYAQVVRWYLRRGIKFFLFGPQLTLVVSRADVCYLPTQACVIYENGANVKTGFVTNLLPGVRLWTAPPLVRALKAAQPEKSIQAKHTYPDCLVTTATLGKVACREVDFMVRSDECAEVSSISALRAAGKSLFGRGFLLSDRAAADRAAADRAAADRAAGVCISLSPSEQAIIDRLNGKR